MDGKINFIVPFKYVKHLASYLKTALGKAFTLSKPSKQASLHTHKVNILSKIIKSHTWTINSCFLIAIILLCVLAIVISYYEQHYKFKQQLTAKTELAHSRIEKTIKSYYTSLTYLGHDILRNARYLESKKVLQLLKITYSTDENIRLLPVTWRPLDDPDKAFSTHGEIIDHPDKKLKEKLNSNKNHQFLIYDQLDKQDEQNLIMCSAVVEEVNSANEDSNSYTNRKKQNLIGYLFMPVKASLILQPLYDIFDNDDLLRISSQDQTTYFNKQKNIFHISYDLSLTNYQFANEISFLPYPYKIAVGKNTRAILANILQVSSLRCAMILAIGGILLLIYNLVERKKALELFNDNGSLIEENYFLKQQVQNLTENLDKANEDNENLMRQNYSHSISAKAIAEMERQIHQGSRIAIGKMRDHNNLLVKHCSKQQELDHEKIENTGNSFHEISVDLLNNVVSRKNDIAEVDIEELIDEVLDIYSPLIITNLIVIKKNIDKKRKIITNELILKQVLISLIARSLYLLAEKSTINISTNKTLIGNNLNIEISNDGFGFDESNFNRIFVEGKNNLLPGLINIQLEFPIMKRLIKEILLGNVNTNNPCKLILSLPFHTTMDDKYKNLIHLPV